MQSQASTRDNTPQIHEGGNRTSLQPAGKRKSRSEAAPFVFIQKRKPSDQMHSDAPGNVEC